MALFKCKMCGGDIHVESNAAFGTCESCGITSTLPKVNEERIVGLFNRANHFRRLNEFDKALAAYENILNEDPTNAEAHWCVVLCRYGIEYVEDPKTYQRIPTCNRTQFASILTDADYLAAIENAPDSYTKGLYETEAKKINEIQKGILAISGREEPFDVFICYKETTDGGSRTKDSTLAQDIYYALTKEGCRVFFARITLEDKLGQEYEPYIFNALNSAKAMLVVGTKPEHFNAVWVKNEWSRFLTLVKSDRSRLLIPCYRDMDAYDLPDELSHLQAQDMGKIGFLQDLVYGIKKVLDTNKVATKDAFSSNTEGDYYSDLRPENFARVKRGYIFLENEEWEKAEEYFSDVAIRHKHTPAYIGLMCARWRRSLESMEILFAENSHIIDDPTNYNQVVRFEDLYVAQVLLEEGRPDEADSYYDKVLDREPEYAPAYEGKLKAEIGILHISQLADAGQFPFPLTEFKNYRNLYRFTTPEQRKFLDECNQAVIEHLEKRRHQLAQEGIEKVRRAEQEKIAEKARTEEAAKNMKILDKHRDWRRNNLCGYCGGKMPLISKISYSGKCKACGKQNADWYNKGESEVIANLGLGSFILKQQRDWYDRKLCWNCGGDLTFLTETCKRCERKYAGWKQTEADLVKNYRVDYEIKPDGKISYKEIDESAYVFRMTVKSKFPGPGGSETNVSGKIECGTINVNDSVDVFRRGKQVMSRSVLRIAPNSEDFVSAATKGQYPYVSILLENVLPDDIEEGDVMQILSE